MKKILYGTVAIGFGMGGFIDGIVLHQIFQWHNMMSNKVPPVTMHAMKYNMMWDGFFHLFTWIVTLLGIYYVVFAEKAQEQERVSKTFFTGALILGWGAFNIIEGIINHQLLQLHNVKEVTEPMVYNITFLILSTFLVIAGFMMIKNKKSYSEITQYR